MEESSESGHSGGCWRALPAHDGRKEDREEEVVSQEEREERREGEERKTAQCKTDLATQSTLKPALPMAAV